jgi:acetyl-CoA/propionyl-CoA carboxylase biotin carboxyl carrier protein
LHTPEPVEKRHRVKPSGISKIAGDGIESPMQGTVVKILKANGDRVQPGDLIVVLEAMKMEQPLIAHKAGTITKLNVGVGQTVASGALLCTIED